MSKSSLILFYIPIPNEKCGEDIAKELIQKKLIACANIFPTHKAIYQWEDQVQSESENVMILKSLKEKAPQVEELVKDLHPYDCPCILQIEPSQTNSDFLHWAQQQIT